MKHLKVLLLTAIVLMAVVPSFSQRVKLVEGSLPNLNGESTINIEFTYDNIAVGKYKTEQEYIKDKAAEYNKKEPGKGDDWAKSWEADRQGRCEPKFEELYTKYSEKQFSGKAKYTIIFHTSFLEPGYNIGISRKSASMNGEALIVETSNKSKVLAKISVEKAPGGALWGTDFDTGARLAETYATAGRALAKFIKKD